MKLEGKAKRKGPQHVESIPWGSWQPEVRGSKSYEKMEEVRNQKGINMLKYRSASTNIQKTARSQ